MDYTTVLATMCYKRQAVGYLSLLPRLVAGRRWRHQRWRHHDNGPRPPHLHAASSAVATTSLQVLRLLVLQSVVVAALFMKLLLHRHDDVLISHSHGHFLLPMQLRR